MVVLSDLWLAILLSGVAVFVVSSVLHMFVPIHRNDFAKLPSEEGVLEGMRNAGVQPGSYMFPCGKDMKDMGTPEMIAKLKLGPVGFMTVVPSGSWNMGKSLGQWFVFSVVVSLLVAYVGTLALDAGADFRTVFRLTSTVAVIGYALSHAQDSIWKGLSWTVTLKFFFDGVVYGLSTGAVFGWLWPAA